MDVDASFDIEQLQEMFEAPDIIGYVAIEIPSSERQSAS